MDFGNIIAIVFGLLIVMFCVFACGIHFGFSIIRGLIRNGYDAGKSIFKRKEDNDYRNY